MADNGTKVEQFIVLAKTARGLALVDLIAKATAEPGLFTYGELLSLPGVQEASGCAWWTQQEEWELGAHVMLAAGGVATHVDRRRPAASLRLLQLRAGEHSSTFSLLELFAYGTWADYKGMCRSSRLLACLVRMQPAWLTLGRASHSCAPSLPDHAPQ